MNDFITVFIFGVLIGLLWAATAAEIFMLRLLGGRGMSVLTVFSLSIAIVTTVFVVSMAGEL